MSERNYQENKWRNSSLIFRFNICEGLKECLGIKEELKDSENKTIEDLIIPDNGDRINATR
jgi:hypothetical protein